MASIPTNLTACLAFLIASAPLAAAPQPTGIFGIALKKGTRSPFQLPDELHPAKPKDKEDDDA